MAHAQSPDALPEPSNKEPVRMEMYRQEPAQAHAAGLIIRPVRHRNAMELFRPDNLNLAALAARKLANQTGNGVVVQVMEELRQPQMVALIAQAVQEIASQMETGAAGEHAQARDHAAPDKQTALAALPAQQNHAKVIANGVPAQARAPAQLDKHNAIIMINTKHARHAHGKTQEQMPTATQKTSNAATIYVIILQEFMIPQKLQQKQTAPMDWTMIATESLIALIPTAMG